MNIGLKLSEQRRRKGLSYEQLAELCGMSIDSLIDVESGRSITDEAVKRLADALELDVSDLASPDSNNKLDYSFGDRKIKFTPILIMFWGLLISLIDGSSFLGFWIAPIGFGLIAYAAHALKPNFKITFIFTIISAVLSVYQFIPTNTIASNASLSIVVNIISTVASLVMGATIIVFMIDFKKYVSIYSYPKLMSKIKKTSIGFIVSYLLMIITSIIIVFVLGGLVFTSPEELAAYISQYMSIFLIIGAIAIAFIVYFVKFLRVIYSTYKCLVNNTDIF